MTLIFEAATHQLADIIADVDLQPRVELNKETVLDYHDVLLRAGKWCFDPVLVVREEGDNSGTVLLVDGFHRVEALRRAAILHGLDDTLPTLQAVGTRREAKLLSLGCNTDHGLRRTSADKRKVVLTMLDDPEWGDQSKWSNVAIAKLCQVSEGMVRDHRKKRAEEKAAEQGALFGEPNTEASGDACEDDNDCDDDIDDNCPEPAPASSFEPSGVVESVAGGTGDDGVATTAPTTTATDDDTDDDDEPLNAREAILSSNTNDWYTPTWILHHARTVLGSIELDPASCTEANERVQAERIITIEDDALLASCRWEAKTLWLNPPYGGLTSAFTSKLIGHYRRGEVDEAIVLVNACPDRKWFDKLWGIAAAVCFLRRRVHFVAPGGEPGPQPTHGSAVFFLTTGSVRTFVETFAEHGRVVVGLSSAQSLRIWDPTARVAL